MVGDQHGPYWALFSKGGKLNAQLIERPGPHFIGNAENARQRIARVMVVEVSPEHEEVPGIGEMSMVSRFDLHINRETGNTDFKISDDTGMYVLATDYDALAAELAESRQGRWPQIADGLNDRDARIRELEAREAEAWALLTDVRFCGRKGLHDDIDKWLAAYDSTG